MNVNVPQPHELSDEELVEQVIGGAVEAFGTIVKRYEQKLLRYGHRFLSGREDIEDIVQEVFLKAYQNLRSFDLKRRFSPWIYRIAHNSFVNEMRRSSRHPVTMFEPDVLLPHKTIPSPEDDRQSVEMKEMLRAGLDALDEKYREPLILYYLEDMSYASIAEVLRLPVSTVGVRISRGKSALKKNLKNPEAL